MCIQVYLRMHIDIMHIYIQVCTVVALHPLKLILAAGATDSVVSIYTL